MKNLALLTLIVLLQFPFTTQGQWQEVIIPMGIEKIQSIEDRIYAQARNDIFFSEDQGQNWSALDIGYTTIVIYDMTIDGKNIYLATSNGLLVSEDEGESFQWAYSWFWDSTKGVDVENGYGWSAISKWGDRSGPNRKTPGSEWKLQRGDGIPWSHMSMEGAFADPISPGRTAYFNSTEGNAYVTRDSGENWSSCPYIIESLEIDGVSYAFSQSYYSTNTGLTWNPLALSAKAIIKNPQDEKLILGHDKGGIYLGDPERLKFVGLKNHIITDFSIGENLIYALTEEGQMFHSALSELGNQYPYYHAFQNFDDDVFRNRTYSNLWGGNAGIINGDSTSPQIKTRLVPEITRTGFGRSLAISYGPLDNWSMYVESFNQKWFDKTELFNLQDLFPDFLNPQLASRKIDSLLFYVKLDSTTQPLALKLELEDVLGGKSTYQVRISAQESWQKVVIALSDFSGTFDARKAKFLGLNFDRSLNSAGSKGVLYIDDFYWVESDYQKPSFSFPDEMLAYINEVSFRHFWMAVDSKSKFAWDRQIWNDLISVDAIGFQLSSYIIAHQNGWVQKEKIEERVRHILHFLLYECKHAEDASAAIKEPLKYSSVKGNWAHFLGYDSLGVIGRKDNSTEYSLFSNCLLNASFHAVQEYFQEDDIIKKADSLIRLTDWNFLNREEDGLMYYDWKPETGYSLYYTDFFTEELDLAFLLGVSSPEPSHRLRSNPYHNNCYRKLTCDSGTGEFVYSAPGASFTYFFLQMYAKFDNNSSRYSNTKNALLSDKKYSNEVLAYLEYDHRIWGQTAFEGPDSSGVDTQTGMNISNYHARGAATECRFDEHNDPNGSIAIYGSLSGILHTTQESIAAAEYYFYELDSLFRNDFNYEFWSPIFGFPDAFHLDPEGCDDPEVNILDYNGPWLSVPRFGIDIGPMLMNIDSYLKEKEGEKSLRGYFTLNPYLEDSLIVFETLEGNPDQCSSVTNIQHSLEELKFHFYPNPAKDLVEIEIDANEFLQVELRLIDIRNRLLRAKKIDLISGDNHFQLQLENLPKGLYFIQLENGNYSGIHKIVKN